MLGFVLGLAALAVIFPQVCKVLITLGVVFSVRGVALGMLIGYIAIRGWRRSRMANKAE